MGGAYPTRKMLQFVREVLKRNVLIQRRRALFAKLARLASVLLHLRLRKGNRHVSSPRSLTFFRPIRIRCHDGSRTICHSRRWFNDLRWEDDLVLTEIGNLRVKRPYRR